MNLQEQPTTANNKRGKAPHIRIAHLIELAKKRGQAVFDNADDYIDTFPDEVG